MKKRNHRRKKNNNRKRFPIRPLGFTLFFIAAALIFFAAAHIKKFITDTHYFRVTRIDADFDIGNTKSQVVPVMVGDDLKLREVSKLIQEKGLYTGVVTNPAVSKKKTRLRLSVSSLHTKEQIDKCVDIIKEVFRKLESWTPSK